MDFLELAFVSLAMHYNISFFKFMNMFHFSDAGLQHSSDPYLLLIYRVRGRLVKTNRTDAASALEDTAATESKQRNGESSTPPSTTMMALDKADLVQIGAHGMHARKNAAPAALP
eukprot:5873815-Pleurochrysis_carterae.AAC.4